MSRTHRVTGSLPLSTHSTAEAATGEAAAASNVRKTHQFAVPDNATSQADLLTSILPLALAAGAALSISASTLLNQKIVSLASLKSDLIKKMQKCSDVALKNQIELERENKRRKEKHHKKLSETWAGVQDRFVRRTEELLALQKKRSITMNSVNSSVDKISLPPT